jgi:AraC-like DNA-binding protein
MLGSTSALSISAALEGLGAIGLDRRALMSSAALSLGDLTHPERCIPDPAYQLVWRAARALARRETVGIEAGLGVPHGLLGPLDYLAASASTVGEAMGALASFSHLISGESTFELERERGTFVVHWVNHLPFEEAALSDEFVVAVLLGRLRKLSRGALGVVDVGLTRGAARVASAFAAPIQARVSFGHATARIVLRDTAWHSPLATAEPHLHTLLYRLLQSTRDDEVPRSTIAALVHREVRASLDQGERIALARIARRLGTSQRTLQRRLSEEATSFACLVDTVRRARALEMLRDPGRTLDEAAAHLDFSDARALSRAFHRWTGTSLRRWRAGPDR